MKTKHYIFYSFALLIGLSSCFSELDETPVDIFDKYYVFQDSLRAEAFVNSLSNELPDAVSASYNRLQGNAMLASATDEATHVSVNKSASNAAWRISSGNWGPSNMRYYRSDDGVGNLAAWYRWGGYSGIRKANVALDGLELTEEGVPLYGSRSFVNRLKGEAIFFKALSHFFLFQKWGGIPIIDKTYSDEENLNIPRSSVKETVDYIIQTADKAYQLLPNEPYSGNEAGRADRGATLALKSRILLYAASPLYNGNGFDGSRNPLICYGNYDPERWKLAAEAAQELIDLGWYELYYGAASSQPQERYAKLFTSWTDEYNKEYVIVGRLRQANRDTENDNFPAGFTNASGGTCPSQELVDAYEMEDGSLFDWNNEVHRNNPYVKRDPRFYASIIYHGARYSRFANVTNGYTFNMLDNGTNRTGNAATTTGYYLNKFMDYSVANPVGNSGNVQHEWCHFRYAEAFLNYAESANEYGGPEYKIAGAKSPLTPIEAINIVRARAGMPDVVTTFANRGWILNKENMRKLIHNERRIELAFEEHRYYDVRRWMSIQDGAIHGVRITNQTGNLVYTIEEVEKKVFDPKKHFFFPIPYVETVLNKSLEQNPGW